MCVTSQAEAFADALQLVREKLAAKPDGVIESVAREVGVSTLAVLSQLPTHECVTTDAKMFDAIWQDVTGWNEVLVIVHTADIVLECVGQLPPGSLGRGYFNFHGESPVSGHLRADACQSIVFVDRQFHGRRSCSIQFFNGSGEAIFKIFVRRDASREMLPDQLAKFEALINQCRQSAGSPVDAVA